MTGVGVTGNELIALQREVVRTVLPNGLVLLVRRDASAPVVSIVTHVKVGYFDETDSEVGISHVLEHMYFKGTSTRGVGGLARETKACGGQLNAHTIYDHTAYHTTLPSASFSTALELQYDAYANSLIDAGELAREIEVIVQEVKRKRDKPSPLTTESLYNLLHDHHRIRRWRMGEEDALRRFTSSDVRSFYRRWYQPANTIVAVVGDVDPDVVLGEVMRTYGSLSSYPVVRENQPYERSDPGVRYRELGGDFKQHITAIGWRAPGIDHPDAAALELAGIVLGTGRASRFYRAVRERKLATSASAWHQTAGTIGVFQIAVESPVETAGAALTALWSELVAARDEGVCSSEVKRARQILEARWLRRLESMDGQALFMATWEARGGVEKGFVYQDALLSTSADEVQSAMQSYLDSGCMSVVSCRPNECGPFVEGVDELQRLLDSGRQAPRPALLTPSHSLNAISDVDSTAGGAVDQAAGNNYRRVASPASSQDDLPQGVMLHYTQAGTPIITVRRPGAPLAHIGVITAAGAVEDPASHEGLARLAAHTMLKGTLDRSGSEIAEFAENMGSSIGVVAGLERAGWTMSIPNRHVQTAIELLGDVVQRPLIPDDGIETERTLAAAEAVRIREDMYRWPMRLAVKHAFGDHPYSRSVLGNEETLSAIARGDVMSWHQHHVLNGPTVIAVVADLEHERMVDWCSASFHSLSYSSRNEIPQFTWPEESGAIREDRNSNQSALVLAFPGAARSDPDRFALRVLSAMASGLGGRLFSRLRDEKSLAYTVSAFPIEQRLQGLFMAYIATDPDRVDEARESLLMELGRFGDGDCSADEIRRAKRYLVGTRAIARQSGAAVLGDLLDSWISGESLSESARESMHIESVTAEDVIRVARRCLNADSVIEALVHGAANRRESSSI